MLHELTEYQTDLEYNGGMYRSEVLYKAIRENNVSCVMYLLENSSYDILRNLDMYRVIHNAIHKNNIELSIKLLEFFKYSTIELFLGDAMVAACSNGQLQVVKYIHQNFGSDFECLAIDYSAKRGYIKPIQYLVQEGLSKFGSCNAVTNAASEGYQKIVEYLCENGFKCNEEALDKTTHGRYFDIIQYLVEVQKVKCTVKHQKTAIKVGYLQGLIYFADQGVELTPELYLTAAEYGYIDICKHLYDHNVPLDKDNDEYINCATRNGFMEIVEFFIGKTPATERTVQQAVEHGYDDMVKYFVEQRTPMYAKDVLEYAIGINNYDLSRKIIENYPNVGLNEVILTDVANNGGGDIEMFDELLNRFPEWKERFDFLSLKGELDMIKHICLKYPKIKIDPRSGTCAVRYGRYDTLCFLTENNLLDKNSCDLTSYVAFYGDLNMFIYVVENGYKVDVNGALLAGISEDNMNIISYLIDEHGTQIISLTHLEKMIECNRLAMLKYVMSLPGLSIVIDRTRCMRYAMENGAYEIIQYLWKTNSQPYDFSITNEIVHIAVTMSEFDIIKRLITDGLPVMEKSVKYAINNYSKKNVEIMYLLIEATDGLMDIYSTLKYAKQKKRVILVRKLWKYYCIKKGRVSTPHLPRLLSSCF